MPESAGAGSASITVLHVDDDPNDIELFRAAVARAQSGWQLQNVSDGEQAIAYLKGSGSYSDRMKFPMPSLVLLDLKLPRATGFEVLTWVRNEPATRDLPVLILSGSDLQGDKARAAEKGASAYVVKPLGFEELIGVIQRIAAEWPRR